MAGETIPFRLAQLTDVHLGPLPPFGLRYWNLKRALGYANWQRKRSAIHLPQIVAAITADLSQQAADHIAVTGDLVNIGLPDEYVNATRWLTALGTPDEISVIPGNHDIYTRLGRDPGIAHWSAYMASDDYGQTVRAQSAIDATTLFPSLRRFGHIALIGLNSAEPTPPAVATGRVGEQQLAALGKILDRTGTDGLCRIIMIHHSPMPGSGGRMRGLVDASKVVSVLARHGAELIIHGHNHRDETDFIARFDSVGASIPVIGAASASTAVEHHGEPLARYNIFDVRPEGRSWRITLTTRGLKAPNGPIGEIAIREVSHATHAKF